MAHPTKLPGPLTQPQAQPFPQLRMPPRSPHPHGTVPFEQQPKKPKRFRWPTMIISALAVLGIGIRVGGSGDDRRTPMPLLRRLLSATLAACAALALAGCNGIPRETPPVGWTLDVHQPGAWWEKPLIPRALIVERCEIKPTWGTDPDLSRLDALPPGSDLNLLYFMDDHHCNVGWQKPVSREHIAWSGPQNETWYRRVCWLSGLDLSDRGWRFLSRYDSRVGGNMEMTNYSLANAAFVDEFDAVVTCEIGGDRGPNDEWGSRGGVQLQSAAPGAQPAGVCPVHAEPLLFTNGPGSSARKVTVNGAGAVRDKAGAKMGDAEALRLHVPGDSVTVTVPVVEGIALADFEITPTHVVPIDPAGEIALAGEVLDASGRTVATCG
jgi:hypothetical protein